MTPEIPFVLGFAVNPSISEVLLIEKKYGPSFNIGKWNGIGGKIEIGEGPRSAMAREFHEECGIKTQPVDWTCFHIETHRRVPNEQFKNPRIYCMTTVLDDMDFASYLSTTDELVSRFSLHTPPAMMRWAAVYNLWYLLEMVKCWHKHPERQWLEG